VGSALDDLIALLDLEALEVNLFRGVSPDEDRQRVFGGQVAGQALVAAGRTVPEDRPVHSLHAYFLRPGDPTVPIVYEVDRIRDGRSFCTRRVVAIQHGRAIFNLQASFHVAEPGLDHQVAAPDVPPAESLPTLRGRLEPYRERYGEAFGRWIDRPRPIDMRTVGDLSWFDPTPREPCQDVWIRADGVLPDDPMLHACVVVYASDFTILDTATLPHGFNFYDNRLMMASLDHAMWFHQPFRADDWLLYHQHSPIAHGARGLAEGSIFTRDGRLAVTVMQEGLLRPVDPSRAAH